MTMSRYLIEEHFHRILSDSSYYPFLFQRLIKITEDANSQSLFRNENVLFLNKVCFQPIVGRQTRSDPKSWSRDNMLVLLSPLDSVLLYDVCIP